MAWLHPDALWILAVVPLVALCYGWAAWQRRKAAARFGEAALVRRLTAGISARRRRWKASFVVLGTLLLGLTLAGPQCGTRVQEVEREGVDLIIALDVSTSMLAEDVAPNRLERAKNEIKKLLDDLRGDRVGLVIFAGDAFVQCPLTIDYGAVRLFLDVADPSLLPTPGTDFGAALTTALDAFDVPEGDGDDEGRSRALLILSDGENHAEGIDEVVEQARAANVVLYTAGVGEPQGVRIPVRRTGGQTVYKKDRAGNEVRTRLEEDALQRLAQDGAYFRIARTSSSLPGLVASLERLDKTTFGAEQFEEYDAKYQWPLAAALLLLLVERLVSDRRRTVRRTASDEDAAR
jgi:Ca-activated chloride channel family protein